MTYHGAEVDFFVRLDRFMNGSPDFDTAFVDTSIFALRLCCFDGCLLLRGFPAVRQFQFDFLSA